MGWYRIDPYTGEVLPDQASSLSQPPDFVLLNAVPGADDEVGACYFGDGPSDMCSSFVGALRELLPEGEHLTEVEVRDLLHHSAIPARLTAQDSELRQAVKEFWKDIDGCYEDDWERPATADERRWVCVSFVGRFQGDAEA